MELYSARSLLLRVFIGCLVAAVATGQTSMQLKVFRGTLVHSRVRTEMEVLEDYLIGVDENNYGRVSCRNHIHTRRIRSEVNVLHIHTLRHQSQQDGRSFTVKPFLVRVNKTSIRI